MKALILGAGQGTRLRPITDNKPKCMVEFCGRPLIDWQESAMKTCEIQDIAVVGGYCAEVIRATHRNVILNPRYMDTNMVASLMCAREWIGDDDDLIISYGDIIYQPNIAKSIAMDDADISVVIDEQWKALWELRMDNPLDDAETLKLGPNRKLLELGKKPKGYDDIQGQYIGLIRISRKVVRRVFEYYDTLDKTKLYDGQSFDQMYMTSFIQGLCNSKFDVRACLIAGGWIEIDSQDDLKVYEELAHRGTLAKFLDLNLFDMT